MGGADGETVHKAEGHRIGVDIRDVGRPPGGDEGKSTAHAGVAGVPGIGVNM